MQATRPRIESRRHMRWRVFGISALLLIGACVRAEGEAPPGWELVSVKGQSMPASKAWLAASTHKEALACSA